MITQKHWYTDLGLHVKQYKPDFKAVGMSKTLNRSDYLPVFCDLC